MKSTDFFQAGFKADFDVFETRLMVDYVTVDVDGSMTVVVRDGMKVSALIL